MRRSSLLCAVLTLLAIALAQSARALTADQLLLIVNKNEPAGTALATFYAQARHVPPGRIVALDLPTGDELTFEQFDRDVVPPILTYLDEHHLKDQVNCLVTFYGVPLRVSARKPSPQEQRELEQLRAALGRVTHRLSDLAGDAERIAADVDPSFVPLAPPTTTPAATSDSAASDLDFLVARVNHAGTFVSARASAINDPAKRQDVQTKFMSVLREFTAPRTPSSSTKPGPAESAEVGNAAPATPPTSQPKVSHAQIDELQRRRFDPAARAELRNLAAREGGLYGVARMLDGQLDYLIPADTEAALDNELALLDWTFYKRSQWLANPLHYLHAGRFSNGGAGPPPRVLMTMRLDAPTPQQVRDIIAASVTTERGGLTGNVILDARGKLPRGADGKADPFGIVDESIRELAALIKAHTSLPVTLDNTDELIKPGTVKDAAIYCGWYSPGKYVPGMNFARGAVGYHIGSFEMVSLHDPHNQGWCRGLIKDGVAATVGPVSEPYLHAFPIPHDFFALLLTGRLTLAEVYWRTTPLVSWRMAAVGDPLYTPFKNKPALKVDDLSEPLRAAAEFTDTSPATALSPP